MRVKADCIPCYLKQAVSTLRIVEKDEKEMNDILYKTLEMIPGLDPEASPGENSSLVLNRVYELIGNRDPYHKAKKEWNNYVMERYDRLCEIYDCSKDKLLTAFKIAVAGNIIDMGITPDFDIGTALNEITAKDFDYDDFDQFEKMLESANCILILGDNSGEIVFDKILVTELNRRGLEIIYAVKDGPILNDATMEDADEVGMTSLCKVISNGNKLMGVSEDRCSEEFLTLYEKADIVISKGQANFESLESSKLAGDKTFFVLRAKCPLVAKCLGINLGEIALKRNILVDQVL